eukprot:TRINITY_DN53314_c0_g1_i1.p1 TRINITY_DN53314_c0_g1~~TRINITY_DN53314_c0_g1_i1.p1  ORF type:complete len:188 (-),score=31.30 TRINITY_DN53314_c0_g1_i1:37-600(-)
MRVSRLEEAVSCSRQADVLMMAGTGIKDDDGWEKRTGGCKACGETSAIGESKQRHYPGFFGRGIAVRMGSGFSDFCYLSVRPAARGQRQQRNKDDEASAKWTDLVLAETAVANVGSTGANGGTAERRMLDLHLAETESFLWARQAKADINAQNDGRILLLFKDKQLAEVFGWINDRYFRLRYFICLA